MTRYQQPWLHDLEIAVRGNVTSLGDRLGDMGAAGTGLFVDDERVVTVWSLTVDGEAPAPLASGSTGDLTRTSGVARGLGDTGPDPTVELHRERRLVDHGMVETVTIASHAGQPVTATVTLDLAADGADIATVKGGASDPLRELTVSDTGVEWHTPRHSLRLTGDAGSAETTGPTRARWSWVVSVPPGGSQTLTLSIDVARSEGAVFATDAGWDRAAWDAVEVTSDDPRLGAVVAQSVTDLRGLLLTDPEEPADVFAGAGTPWYLTLFGRDSLWAARFMLPFGTELAGGTLRALARRQGTRTDPTTAEAPGKILHEVRRTAYVDPVTGMALPPVYYGSVDATPLWLRLVHDAWRWGIDESEVRALRSHIDAALGWLAEQAESGDGLLRYVDESGSGLANQGWKDSGDSMRRDDGSVAPAPIALVETQAYAVAAARGAADLLESVWGEDGDSWRSWADDLSGLVRERFWVEDVSPRFLAMAIDGEGRQVDGIGSNMGHVLGTGLLTDAEARRTAHVLTREDLLGAGGIGTLSRDNPAYNPIGYHTGSVWTHDNAVAVLGLAAEGFADEAGRVIRCLVDVASRVENRWPELYGGELLLGSPVPYPASCRPQAWAAASVGALVEASLGLAPDAPRRSLRLSPVAASPFGAMTVRGLRVGDVPVSVRMNAEGEVIDVDAPGLDVTVA
ncbi:glycogen debranching enzyme [Knoellia remsis]|uniref:Glycogen debranching enzyme n=1 Tax=Knoellia remsis TaxID=407159 RepID=A0A2T0UXC5_9MICO|nr:glycogen debranching N-terminal domain-containing protein [Knoellia remsis]PRY62580.1 glycogen debranching enzyme [Knoellia remsis]